MMNIIPSIIPTKTTMKKPAIMKKLMIAIRSMQEAEPAAPTRPTPAVAPSEVFNQYGSFCCRFAAGAVAGNK